MSPRLAWLLIATLVLPTLALAQAEDEVVKAIHARLDAVARNDIATWATFVADDMMAPIEGATRSKESWITQHKSWPREVRYSYGPLQDVKVRVNGDTAIATGGLKLQGTDESGKPFDIHLNWTDTWVKMPDGKWQCAATHGSNVEK